MGPWIESKLKVDHLTEDEALRLFCGTFNVSQEDAIDYGAGVRFLKEEKKEKKFKTDLDN